MSTRKFTTHKPVVDALGLHCLTSAFDSTDKASNFLSASDSIAQNDQPSEFESSPFIVLRRLDEMFHFITSLHARDEHMISHQVGARIMKLIVFSDFTAALMWWDEADTSTINIIPWSFRLAGEVDLARGNIYLGSCQFGESGPSIHRLPAAPGGDVSLFNEHHSDGPELAQLRHDYLEEIRVEMALLVKAFEKSIPLATGPDWLDRAWQGGAALPVFRNSDPFSEPDPTLMAFLSDLAIWALSTSPRYEEIEIRLLGRTVNLDGLPSDLDISIRDGDGEHFDKFEDRVAVIFETHRSPIPIPQQIAYLTLHNSDVTSHQRIEAHARMAPLFA